MFCGPYAAACAAYGNYNVNRAFGASKNDALRSGVIAGVSTWAFSPAGGPPTVGDAAFRLGMNRLTAENPEIGQALMFLYGNWGEGIGDWAQNAVGMYAEQKVSKELARFAAKNGMTLQELNLLLALNSKLGKKLIGSTFRNINGVAKVEGFTARSDGVLSGLLGKYNGFVGAIWDVNDTLLNAQGLLDAVSLDVVESGLTHAVGHSLGAWRVNNLHRQGFITTATTLSLPALAYPSAGTRSHCGDLDMICGTGLVTPLRPNTTGFSSGQRFSGNPIDLFGFNHMTGTQDGYGEHLPK